LRGSPLPPAVFRKILIANRGEIAVRVARAARELGIQPIGVYSDADAGAYPLRFMAESHRLGPAPPRDSYLRIDRILEIASQSGAEAVHPGYGFLAENPAFPAACEEAGVAFVGPSAAAMRLAGDKLQARRQMKAYGVPVTAGSEALRDAEEAKTEAARIGYPVILKLSGGGGGIGMHVVETEADMERLYTMAVSTGRTAFKDPTVFLEKYLPRPRHIEIQYIADRHGHAIHLGERECSIQRRHQKLIEEAPSPAVTPEMRRDLGEKVVRGMAAMGYANAGTAEFLLQDGEFHFNEINARLQVEHPVTEAVTGLDLVRLQLHIAAGEDLGIAQEDVVWRGHALECRINAEDPLHDFLPSPGTLTEFHAPGGPGVRVDAGIMTGSMIPPDYDSLIAKIVTQGSTRHAAVSRMTAALHELRVEGVVTNREFHLASLQAPAFRSGALSTRFIEEEGIEAALRSMAHGEREDAATVAVLLAVEHSVAARSRRRVSFRPSPPSTWASGSAPGRRS